MTINIKSRFSSICFVKKLLRISGTGFVLLRAQMSFQSSNQQRQNTEGYSEH